MEASHINTVVDESTLPSSGQPLLSQYYSDIANGELSVDPYQKEVIMELQIVYDNLIKLSASEDQSYFEKLFSWHLHKASPELNQGLYIWGGVGRGKTFLVNYFFKHLPIKKKLRLHFYRFMQLVHEELDDLDDVSDPLQVVAKRLAEKAHVLYLDEMLVNDITDAMLLSRLFEHLFNLGVVLITTSNLPPDELYKDGLQRERFLPAIALLENHTKIIKMGGEIDYRLKILEENGVYHITSDEDKNNIGLAEAVSEQLLDHYFSQLSGVELHNDRTDIIINKRRIPVKKWADGIVWFDFNDLCNTPRSAIDYIQIAMFFKTVLISNIPTMDSSMDDAARRFVIMIDAFYDYRVKLVISAAAEPEYLYTSSKLAFEFKRTASRLREMQSTDYLAKHHSLIRDTHDYRYPQ